MDTVFLIVDDHPMIIEGYCTILKKYYPTALFYKASTIEEALTISNKLSHIDFLLIDYQIGSSKESFEKIHNGVDLANWFRKEHPNSKILMITAHEEALIIYSIHKKSFPDGLLIKRDVNAVVLETALSEIKTGALYYSEKAKEAMKSMAQKKFLQQEHNVQILLLLDQGYKIKELSSKLFVSESMLNKRIASLKQIFEVSDNGGLLREAKNQGFI